MLVDSTLRVHGWLSSSAFYTLSSALGLSMSGAASTTSLNPSALHLLYTCTHAAPEKCMHSGSAVQGLSVHRDLSLVSGSYASFQTDPYIDSLEANWNMPSIQLLSYVEKEMCFLRSTPAVSIADWHFGFISIGEGASSAETKDLMWLRLSASVRTKV